MNQVHKETLTHVANALPNRSGTDIEIFGIEGIPEEINRAHTQRVIQQYYQAEADRRQKTGNPPPGGAPQQSKKVKIESGEELKKRLAEHKAKRAAQAAQAAAGDSSGAPTPVGSAQGAQSPAVFQSPVPYPAPTVSRRTITTSLT